MRAAASPSRLFLRCGQRLLPGRIPGRHRQAQGTRAKGCGSPVLGGQRLDARQCSPRPDDDRSRPSAVLWRPGATEKRAGDHDAEFRADGADHGFVGSRRLQLVLWKRSVHRQFRAGVLARCGRGSESRLCRDHSTIDVHGVPANVCRHHSGSDHRRNRRAYEVLRHGAVHDAVVFHRLRAHGTHGVGQGRFPQCFAWRQIPDPRLRRRYRRAHHFRRFRAGLRAIPRQARRLPETANAAAQPGAELQRSLPALGRMVRV